MARGEGAKAAVALLGSHIFAIMIFGAGADDDPCVQAKDLIVDFRQVAGGGVV